MKRPFNTLDHGKTFLLVDGTTGTLAFHNADRSRLCVTLHGRIFSTDVEPGEVEPASHFQAPKLTRKEYKLLLLALDVAADASADEANGLDEGDKEMRLELHRREDAIRDLRARFKEED
jgi:hypothetical protein